MNDRSELAELLKSRAGEVARYLYPAGKQEGREWVLGSIHGEAGRSLKICTEGDKLGIWYDFAAGTGGDLVSLWHECRGGQFGETAAEIRGYLGLENPKSILPARKKEYRKPKPQAGTIKANTAGTSNVSYYLQKERKLTSDTIKAFNLGETDCIKTRAGKDWKNDWIMFPYSHAGEFLGIKYQSIKLDKGKKVVIPEHDCRPTLFGWRTIKSTDTVVCITEGEIDAMSIFQYGHAALSVPFGGGAGDKQQWIEHEYDNLEQFKTIYICMDNDEEGETAAEALVERLGRHRCKIVTLPHKDANKCLQEGVSREVIDQCFLKATSLDPAELKSAESFREETNEDLNPSGGEEPGKPTQFPKLKHLLRFRKGEVSVWSGVNGHGKSLLIGQTMMHLAYEGEKICIASLEMKPRKTLGRIVRQLTNEKKPTTEQNDQCFDWFQDKFWIFNVIGEIDPKLLLETFLYAYQRYGVTHFVIDSFMRCGVDEDDLNGQKKFMNMIVAFVNQYDVHIHLVAHPRKGLNEDHIIGKMDVKGSGCITDLAWNFFAIWRNKTKEAIKRGDFNGELRKGRTPMDEPDALLVCEKQRDGDWEGNLNLYFCPHSERYYDDENYRAPNYLGGIKASSPQQSSMFEAPAVDPHKDEDLGDW